MSRYSTDNSQPVEGPTLLLDSPEAAGRPWVSWKEELPNMKSGMRTHRNRQLPSLSLGRGCHRHPETLVPSLPALKSVICDQVPSSYTNWREEDNSLSSL